MTWVLLFLFMNSMWSAFSFLSLAICSAYLSGGLEYKRLWRIYLNSRRGGPESGTNITKSWFKFGFDATGFGGRRPHSTSHLSYELSFFWGSSNFMPGFDLDKCRFVKVLNFVWTLLSFSFLPKTSRLYLIFFISSTFIYLYKGNSTLSFFSSFAFFDLSLPPLDAPFFLSVVFSFYNLAFSASAAACDASSSFLWVALPAILIISLSEWETRWEPTSSCCCSYSVMWGSLLFLIASVMADDDYF